ncbi:glycosyltransferase [Erysipelotrichaceae bacterium 51-3]
MTDACHLACSVAMTTYNSAFYLKEQLDSIKNQTRTVDEVIIVDDASTNQTPQLIRQYIQNNHLEHWKLVVNPHNLGYIKSFQKALSLCSGKIIFLCDHDDRWHPDKVKIMAKYMEENPQILSLLCSFEKIDKDSKPIIEKKRNFSANNGLIHFRVKGQLTSLNFRDVLIYNAGQGCLQALRKSLAVQYLQIGQNLNLPHDWSISVLASLRQGLYYLDQKLVFYRIYEGNTLGLTRCKNWPDRCQRAHQDAIQKRDLLTLVKRDPKSNAVQKKLARKVSCLYDRREEALCNRDLSDFFWLGINSLIWKGLYRTIGLDLFTVVHEIVN